MKQCKKISVILAAVLTINLVVYATDVKFVSGDEKSIISIFSFFKKKPANGQPVSADEGKLLAKDGTLEVLIDTPTDGRMGYSFKDSIAVKFQIELQPTQGDVTVLDASKGTFTYTPKKGYTGNDTFTFTVSNETYGSDRGTINVTVRDQLTPTAAPQPRTDDSTPSFRYEDMLGHWGEYTAIKMAENNILKGMKIANKYYFYPDTELTRGDFLLYLMADLEIDTSEYENYGSVFADSAEIPSWLSMQANAAYDAGIISGNLENGKIYLRPFDKLTRIEAITMLNNTLKPNTRSVNKSTFADMYLVPEWGYEPVKDMTDYGIIAGYDDNTIRPYVKVTRAMAAEFLWQTYKYKESTPVMMENLRAAMDKELYK